MIKVDTIKQQLKNIPILSVADKLFIERRSKYARCFLHDDKNPSMAFNTSSNTWKCYACNIGGDQITLVMKKLNMSYFDACIWLANNFNITYPWNGIHEKKVVNNKLAVPKPVNSSKQNVDVEIITWIVNNVCLSEKAIDFLFNQRKYKPEIIKDLKIGSISDSNKIISELFDEFGQARILKSGIVRKNSYGFYLFFCTPCLLFPYTDLKGNVVNLQSRYIGDRKEIPRFQFLPGTVSGLFNMKVLNNTTRMERLYISEGVTDCLALLSLGEKAVAIPSATLLKPDVIKILASKNLFMYPDSDQPGIKLYNDLKYHLEREYSYVTKLDLPNGFKDFSEYYVSLF